MGERTLGLDVSFYQDYNGTPQQIDFEKAKANGAKFVIIRASQGLTTDPDLEYNMINAKKAGLITDMYHFWDYRISSSKQAIHFAELCSQYKPDMPPVLDFEKHRDWPLPYYASTLAGIKLFTETFKDAYGKAMMFYTNPNTIKYHFGYNRIPEWLLALDLWIAQYPPVGSDLSEIEPDFYPWATYKFWQWTDREDGLAFGMESKQVDANYFNGSEDDLREYANMGEEEIPEPPVPTPTPCECPEIDWGSLREQLETLEALTADISEMIGGL